MATKTTKNTNETTAMEGREQVKQAIRQLEGTKVSKLVERAPAGEQQNIYVNVNGKGYNIPRGKVVEMPLPVWMVVERKMRAEKRMEEEIREASQTSNL